MNKSVRPPLTPLITPIWLMIIIGALCLVSPAMVWYYQFYSPSDGARMAKQPEATTKAGLYIEVLAENSLLHDGDLVTAVEGIPMAAWAEAPFHPGSWQARWERGETIPYQVIRQGKELEVPVLLGKQPVRAILAENWSVLLFTVVFQVIAIFILLLKPKEPAAQALFLWGMTTSHFYVWSSYLQIYELMNGYGFWIYMIVASFLWLSTWAAGLHLALTFPTSLPLVQRHPRLVWLLYPTAYAIYLIYLAASHLMTPTRLEWIGLWNRGDSLVAVVFFIPAMICLVRQYQLHRSGPERRKIQWVVYSGLFSGSVAVFLYLVPEFLGLPRLGVNAVGLLLIPFPLAIAIAIWRYQLFDINLIIHRTLVYGTLTLTLGLVFVSGVTLLQGLFQATTGQQSPVSIVISTLAIAALFNPVHIFIQNTIDRRFYRRKYDSQKTLERFAAAARNEVEVEQLSVDRLQVVTEALEPEHTSLWMKPAPKRLRRQ